MFTCAQNNTPVRSAVWRNGLALANFYNAQIIVSRFVYDTTTNVDYEKPNRGHGGKRGDWWYDKRLLPFVHDERMPLANGLEWCGELQILPTAKRPITGFESYTGRNSCIIPHPKFAMQSIASGKHEGTKLIYTTGCVTERNYIQRKAGQVAQFHHGFGFLLVEVRDDGHWFCRQINADDNGTIHDLDVKVKNGKVTTGNRVEAIVWGDAHVRRQDPEVTRMAWGDALNPFAEPDCMIDVLRPKYQFFHDLVDFRSRNHHEIGHGRKRFERFVMGGAEDDVGAELYEASRALWLRGRDNCQSIVVASNHDNALLRWLDTADYRLDPRNALTFLKLQTWLYEETQRLNGKTPPLFEHAMRLFGAPANVKFLQKDESFIICPDANGGIECGMHGDLGVNGVKGNVLSYARMGRKSIIGHSHSAGIVDGVYVAGVSASFDLGYNDGPSSWSHSHVVVYPNGKRAIVTMYAGGWRA
jgi:hypothetical protein